MLDSLSVTILKIVHFNVNKFLKFCLKDNNVVFIKLELSDSKCEN